MRLIAAATLGLVLVAPSFAAETAAGLQLLGTAAPARASAPAPEVEPFDAGTVVKGAGHTLLALPFNVGNLTTKLVGVPTNWTPEGCWDATKEAAHDPSSLKRTMSRGADRVRLEVPETWRQRGADPGGTAMAFGRGAVLAGWIFARDIVVTPIQTVVGAVTPLPLPSNERLSDSVANWILLGAGAGISKTMTTASPATKIVVGGIDDVAQVARVVGSKDDSPILDRIKDEVLLTREREAQRARPAAE